MNVFIIFALSCFTATSFGFDNRLHPKNEKASYWVCDGYCFLADVPVGNFQPVSSIGATEKEARENIDCGQYQETGIVCEEVLED